MFDKLSEDQRQELNIVMFNATLYMYNPTCYEFRIHFPFIFPSSCCFSLVFGYNFFVCFFFPNDFGTVMSAVSCTLANNWAKLFCTGGGGALYLKTGANSNVIKKTLFPLLY